ncbi:cell division protein ZapA [Agarivorans sp. Toyoura001]|uniref:cell division protein ZapA n=1 Tax=Agarivorans sp. Toyoura001 TaxID=2283141 RepID=UPI0010D3DCD4|nr:cell division protein ZapA [Agarivorans sp. Toyoura001]GDY25117.1 cell division protein ZapA [Agarivorans sp. Toyoura001]
MAQGVDIILLGKNYRVACPEGEEDKLRQAADELSQRLETLKQKSSVNSTEHLAIMVGLHLSYELHGEQAKNQNYADNMNQRIVELQHTIERALLEQSQPIGNIE